jgi:hypothetical protein
MGINPMFATRFTQLSVSVVLSINPLHVNSPGTAMPNQVAIPKYKETKYLLVQRYVGAFKF